ncbi:Fungal Zn(2)-Cys(6) binuclear cluster domain-containing protein [Penicillium ucsense]|uniref:Fungal Zn(2)-Cys(6) binuclear cluster domain-containing protein n=1 Tax=Penicillium ucsense TaxID=2839758 RepID=A0A8J8W8M2_9EURO|nr:Fungal Zn(2)-Cys(6) binuclear cluster domain-containing protein [Penicillium ucsense]KAF7737131.1 Fungal Zn(2)-Cys(6) binuclear cluster domain-containing protein [Penicillium ucsense]
MASTRDSHSFACDECRLRKSRCSKDRPVCLQCQQLGKDCRYSPKVTRSPLTRQHLTYVEDRLHAFETALSRLFPGGDLDATLRSLLQNPEIPQAPSSKSSSRHSTPAKVDAERTEPAPEALPKQADGFDWAEKELVLGDLADGMAALSIKPEGAGYFGASSSVVPLRALFDHGFDLNVPVRASRSGGVPLKAQLLQSAPSGLIEQAFIDAYFLNYHTSYPFVHEPTFRAQFNDPSLRPHGAAWQILLNTILALGAWSIGDDSSDLDVTFYQEARACLQQFSVFEIGNLTLVQALLLLSNYAQKRNKPNTGWNYLGLAVRMAMSLGLHKEFPGWKISLLQREMRRRLWWGVFIFDSGAAKTFGRPILLPEECVMDCKQVLNIHDEALTPETTTLPLESSGPTLYSGLIAQTQFHLLTNGVYQRLISTPSITPEETMGLQKPMEEWYNGLPPYMRYPLQPLAVPPTKPDPDNLALVRYRLLWRNWNLTILIYRPIVLRWAARRWGPLGGSSDGSSVASDGGNEDPCETQCRVRCLQNARLTITSISEYMDNFMCTRIGAWYMLYFLFQAGLIPIVFLMTDPSNPDASSWLQDIETTKALLMHPSLGHNQLAQRCYEVINRLLGPSPTIMSSFATQGNIHQPYHQQQQAPQQGFMPFPEHIFNDPGFGGGLFPVDHGMPNQSGMDFSEWVNYPVVE